MSGFGISRWAVLFAAVVIAGMGYIRLAPSQAERWHISLALRPAPMGPPSDQVVMLTQGAYVDLPAHATSLAQLDAIALASPRTQRFAGSVAEGRITWITRSRLFGFPDYTTAEATQAGIILFARLRFGHGDRGVNAARLRAWQAALSQK